MDIHFSVGLEIPSCFADVAVFFLLCRQEKGRHGGALEMRASIFCGCHVSYNVKEMNKLSY